MRPLSASALFVFALMSSMGCGGGTTPEPSSTASSPKNGADAGNAAAGSAGKTADGGTGDERPFAGSIAEATALISVAVDKRQSEIGSCVHDFRVRRKMPLGRVSISFGIDQEGRLLGVTSKGKEDAELKSCVQGALKGPIFPRSHAGVITVTKTYEELVQ